MGDNLYGSDPCHGIFLCQVFELRCSHDHSLAVFGMQMYVELAVKIERDNRRYKIGTGDGD